MRTAPTSPDIRELCSHTEFLRQLAYGLLRDEHAAEDAVQNACVVSMTATAKEIRNPRAWLAGVVRNLARMSLRGKTRRRERERRVARPEAVAPAKDAVEHLETARRVGALVTGLPEHYRTVVVLRFYRGRDVRAIAEELGIPAATVRTRLRRALARLRESLDEEHNGSRRAWTVALLPFLGRQRPKSILPILAGGVAVKKIAAGALLLLLLVVGARLALRSAPTAAPAAPGPDRAGAGGHRERENEVSPDPGLETAGPESATGFMDDPPDDVAIVTVRGPDGAPLAGAKILLLRGHPLPDVNRHPEVASEATTDASGRVRLNADPFRRYMLKILHPDCAVTGDIECFGGNRIEVQLTEGGVLTGRVVEADTGRPIAGAAVYVMDWCMLGILHEWTVRTDAEGTYRIDRVAPGMMNMRACAPGRAFAYPTTSTLVTAGRETRIGFSIEKGTKLTLRVVNETGQVVPRVTADYSWGLPVSGPGAAFVTAPLPDGKLGGLELTAPGHVRAYYALDPAKVERPQDPRVVVLHRAIPVRGTVVNAAGRPAPGLEVQLSAKADHAFTQILTRTDSRGEFDVRAAIAGGTLAIRVILPDGSSHLASTRTAPAGAGEIRLGTIHLSARAVIQGAVVTPEGGPPARGFVRAHVLGTAGWKQVASCFLDPRGRFRLTGVPLTDVVLRVGGILGRPARDFHRKVTGDEIVDLRLEAGFRITGRAFDREGRPRPRLNVWLEPSGANAQTDAEGRFRFNGLGPGLYRVHTREESPSELRDIPGDTFDVELRPSAD